jgi:uncharacterized membrane protein
VDDLERDPTVPGTVIDAAPPTPDPAGDVAAGGTPPAATAGGTGLSLRWLRRTAYVVSACLAVGLVIYSVHIYDRFDLTTDFAIANQGLSQIAHGHLDPYSTLNPHNYPHYGYPFWQDHFSLIFWPMALLWLVYPHGIDLLVVQDLCLAGSVLVSTLFVCDLLERRWAGSGRHTGRRWIGDGRVPPAAIGVGALIALAVNPWIYWTASFDFHIQAMATLFLVLAARDLWAGRNWRALLWIALVLSCGNVSATYVFGLGISMVLCRRDLRRKGLGLMGLGLAWALVVGAIGGGAGTLIAANYGYLAHVASGASIGNLQIVTGVLTHPSVPFHMLSSRSQNIYRILAPSGVVGVLDPIGFGITVVVMLSNELNAAAVFSGPVSSFQNLPMVFLVLVGSAEVLAWLGTRPARVYRIVAMVLGGVLLVQAVAFSAVWTPRARPYFLVVDGPTASALARVAAQIPADDEVIASQGVVGRFGDRQLVYPFLDAGGAGQVIPVADVPVVFVLTSGGIEPASPADVAVAAARLRALGAKPLAAGAGVQAYLWTPPNGTRYLTIPPTPGG